MNLDELADHLHHEVLARTEGDSSLAGPDDAFTEIMLEYLTQANETDGGELSYSKRPGRRNAPAYKINAWHLYGESGACLDLFISLHKPAVQPESASKSEIAEHFEWARSFLRLALDGFGGRLDHLEEAAPPFEAAQSIHAGRESLDTVRIFLLTNAVAKQTAEKDMEIEGIEVRHFLWDLEKLLRVLSSGREREVIELDMAGDYDGAVPCLAQTDGTGEYTAYLAFFPAALLAKIYGNHGPRLLEKNVRSYLQARGKVNRGIQQTIRDSPHRFLAYNNGISATAESVEVSRAKDGLTKLERVRDFQIVNGGQTTASIYHALKKEKADISHVTVQVKLTVVNQPDKIAEFVPLISLYANSQNKVNTADFSANDVFHQKLESLSRTVWAPSHDGMSRPTHWYYERARGSHLDDKTRAGTPAKQKAWETENPLSQKFTKTDVAKYEHTWDQLPHLVSRGAEKNFIEWTLNRQKSTIAEPDQDYFQRLVAKALLFRTTEKLVAAQNFGGYRANIVAYSLSWLSRETSQRIDLQKIWQKQAVSQPLKKAIETVSCAACEHLIKGAAGRNVTEWAKKEECWADFRSAAINIPDLSGLMDSVAVKPAGESKTGQAKGTEGGGKASWSELSAQVERIKPDVWPRLETWGRETGQLQAWQASLCGNFQRKLERGKRPTFPECEAALGMLEVARTKGFQM